MAKKIKAPKKGKKGSGIFKKKMQKVMHEYKEGDLNIGKSDKKVSNPKQAVAIALSEAKKAVKRGSVKKSKGKKMKKKK